MAFNAENGNKGACAFKTKDSIEAVSAYYENALKSAGFEVKKIPAGTPGQSIILDASDNKTQRQANVSIVHSEEGTTFNLAFEGK